MSSFNKVLLMGRLTRDPELRVMPNGNKVCKFSIATSRRFKLPDGSLKEETVFVEIDAFGGSADTIAKYFVKGKAIFVEGRLKFDQWEGPNGEKRNKLSVVLETFTFVGNKDGTSEFGEPANYEATSPSIRDDSSMVKAGPSSMEDIDDDVPF